MRRGIFTTLWSILALAGSSGTAQAAAPPPADKLIVLVQSSGCDWASLAPRLDAAGKIMAADKRTTRVSIDRPADAERNLDLMDKPSPFLAAIEVSAPPSALPALARRIERSLASACSAAVYLVHERRLMTTPRSWPLGEPAPASKTLVTLIRKPGLSFETFDQEWAGPHARLSLGWRTARGGNGHYAQNLVVGRLGRAAPLDGIGEAEGPGTSTPQEREARIETAAHARTFQDMDHASMFIAREVILKD